MIKDVELHFAYRAGQEQKEILLSGDDSISLVCDRMMEAIGNIVKNAMDYTKSGDHIFTGFIFVSTVRMPTPAVP